jgi:hypothetical protein
MLSEGVGVLGFLKVVAEEPELNIRHNEPTQRQCQFEQELDARLVECCLPEANGNA